MNTLSRYQELEYVLPTISASEATHDALSVLKDLYYKTPYALPYFMEPSAILLFANLRALSPYHTIGKDITDTQLELVDEVLSKHDCYRIGETTNYEEPNGVFSLVNSKSFGQISDIFTFTQNDWVSPHSYTSTLEMVEWIYITEKVFASRMESGVLPKGWLQDWWAPHNLRFGILLGYPGEAISSNLWADAENKATGLEEPMQDILVADDDTYFVTDVTFYIAKGAATSPSVVQLQQLWKDVIAGVYAEMPHLKMLLNQEFARAYDSLKFSELR